MASCPPPPKKKKMSKYATRSKRISAVRVVAAHTQLITSISRNSRVQLRYRLQDHKDIRISSYGFGIRDTETGGKSHLNHVRFMTRESEQNETQR